MTKYIPHEEGELITRDSRFSSDWTTTPGGTHGSNGYVGKLAVSAKDGWIQGCWRKPVGHNWIKFYDRRPTKDDADKNGDILVYYTDSQTWTPRPWDFKTASNYWMPLNFIDDTPEPIKVDGKSLIPQKDGSVKISCGTIIPAKDVDEFIRQRTEAMK